ncbi:MAG: hypothetical protein ACLTCI_08395 [[Clostridium] nexile]
MQIMRQLRRQYTAYDKLLDMVHHLEFTGNTSSLKVLVDVAKRLEEQFYTAESWKPFTEALKEAEVSSCR